jgi:hypothetical protein
MGPPSAENPRKTTPTPYFQITAKASTAPSDFGASCERAEIVPVYSSSLLPSTCRSSGTLRFSRNYSTPSTIRKSRTAPSPSAFKASAYAALS